VVVTDEGAPPELVGAGQFGLCAQPGAPESFAAGVLRLLEDPTAAAALGARAAQAARQFDAGVIADRVLARYRAVAAARRA
jgi:glycosyltransferase involved in cell wall biosynthesis